MQETIKYVLPESAIPRAWYNIIADLPSPPPAVLHPGTGKPIGPDDLAALFPPALIAQEMSSDREIEIPQEVRDLYRQFRPTPLFRARRFERMLQTPVRIYYKYEGVSPAGSHKPNTAYAQAYYNKQAGIRRLATETGAGQWGSALAIACAAFGMECKVFMVRVSFDQKPYRKALMQAFGAQVSASPSDETAAGRADPGTTSRLPRFLGDRDFRGGGSRGPVVGYQLRLGQRAEPCDAAPDRDRAGVPAAVRVGR